MPLNWVPDSNLDLEAERRERLKQRVEGLERGRIREIARASALGVGEFATSSTSSVNLGGPEVTVHLPDAYDSWVYVMVDFDLKVDLALGQGCVYLNSTAGGNAEGSNVLLGQFLPDNGGGFGTPNTYFKFITPARPVSGGAIPPNFPGGSLYTARPTASGDHTYRVDFSRVIGGTYTATFAYVRLRVIVMS